MHYRVNGHLVTEGSGMWTQATTETAYNFQGASCSVQSSQSHAVHNLPVGASLVLKADATCVVEGFRKGSARWHMLSPVLQVFKEISKRKIAFQAVFVPSKRKSGRQAKSQRGQAVVPTLSPHFPDMCEVLQPNASDRPICILGQQAAEQMLQPFLPWTDRMRGTSVDTVQMRMGKSPIRRRLAGSWTRSRRRKRWSWQLYRGGKPRPWWPQLRHLQVGAALPLYGRLFRGPEGNLLPPPTWGVDCLIAEWEASGPSGMGEQATSAATTMGWREEEARRAKPSHSRSQVPAAKDGSKEAWSKPGGDMQWMEMPSRWSPKSSAPCTEGSFSICKI